jgi:hypothetical protein
MALRLTVNSSLENIVCIENRGLFMKVNILTTDNFISYYFFYPLLVNKRRLRELNIILKYYEKVREGIYDCDAILLDSKYFTKLWNNRENVLSLLKRIKEKCAKVIWLDSTASTGSTHFQVMPYVDKYWKKQVLKDMTLYEREYYGARIYTDYYKIKFNLKDEKVQKVEPLKKEYMDKLYVSWNIGLGPYSTNIKISNIIRMLPWPLKEKFNYTYKLKIGHPSNNRKSISFRGSNNYSNIINAFQRIKTIEKLKSKKVETEPISNKKYLDELRNSMISVSPFGYGEICYRDFEIILAGALLFKPSMEHLKTYPDIYVKNKTYVPFEWDFRDFDEKIDDLINNPDMVKEISSAAMDRYGFLLSGQGQNEFCLRFKTLLMNDG